MLVYLDNSKGWLLLVIIGIKDLAIWRDLIMLFLTTRFFQKKGLLKNRWRKQNFMGLVKYRSYILKVYGYLDRKFLHQLYKPCFNSHSYFVKTHKRTRCRDLGLRTLQWVKKKLRANPTFFRTRAIAWNG